MPELVKTFREGDDNTGYVVGYSALRHRLSVDMKGYWRGDDIPKAFVRDVQHSILALSEHGEWDVAADLRQYSVQVTQVQDIIRGLMVFALQNKFRRGGVAMTSALTRLSIGKLTQLAGIKTLQFCDNMDEVEAFLRQPSEVQQSIR